MGYVYKFITRLTATSTCTMIYQTKLWISLLRTVFAVKHVIHCHCRVLESVIETVYEAWMFNSWLVISSWAFKRDAWEDSISVPNFCVLKNRASSANTTFTWGEQALRVLTCAQDASFYEAHHSFSIAPKCMLQNFWQFERHRKNNFFSIMSWYVRIKGWDNTADSIR